jgi:predicted DNA repair protein MutK
MATSLLALLDDIATVLDDVAVLTKVAARKTAGVLGDDLALNAQQVAGVRAERELPVVWGVFKGSLINKLILVPAALLISAVAPWAITPLLMLGGLYLCYEGVEKLAHSYLQDAEHSKQHQEELTKALLDPDVDLAALERSKIKGAIRTDFILSAEIIVITLGIVAGAAIGTRITVLAGIALLMTVGVYGLVAGIVKLDDLGLHLSRLPGESGADRLKRAAGRLLLRFAPYLMKTLSVVGMLAMFLVGGGILSHGIPALHHLSEGLAHGVQVLPLLGGLLAPLMPFLVDALIGALAGALTLAAVRLAQTLLRRVGLVSG